MVRIHHKVNFFLFIVFFSLNVCVAQLVEHLTVNQKVTGSYPVVDAKIMVVYS